MKISRITSKTLLAISALCGSLVAGSVAHAACNSATVIKISQNPNQCNGNIGFTTSNSGGLIICTANATQGRIVQAAYLSGKAVAYQMTGDNDCNPGTSENEAKQLSWVQAL